MRTYRHLYAHMTSFSALLEAYYRARRGKRRAVSVAEFEYDQESQLIALRDELRAGTWQPGAYHHFYIHDPKKRLISAAPFRDRVVHHALMAVIGPIWESRFIHDTYANRVGKGTHRALDRAQAYLRRYAYFLPCDLEQYFPSIDHAVLRAELARRIADRDVLTVCDRILASGVGALDQEYTMRWFPGDDLFALNRPRGLPIGNLTSQFWANVYLNDFDHWVKRTLHCPAYVRYVDDFVLFGDDKRTLWAWREAIQARLAELRLTLHANTAQVTPVRHGLPFLGFRLYPHRRRLKKRNGQNFVRRLRGWARAYRQGELTLAYITPRVRSWVAHAQHGNTAGLRQAIFRSVRF